MELLGYALTTLLGLSLGLMGAGGSILTVPILVYLFGISPTDATGFSLLIVGLVALAGAVPAYIHGQGDLRTAAIFAPASITGAVLARRVILPMLPESNNGISLDTLLMVAFALLMLAAARAMVKRGEPNELRNHHPIWQLAALGLGVGLLTGLLGAGGGFMIIPALTLVAGLSMKLAVGTSLSIIAAHSLVAFASDAFSGKPHPWGLLLTITGIALGGMLVGTLLRRRIDGSHLRKSFGAFVAAMAVVIIVREFLHFRG